MSDSRDTAVETIELVDIVDPHIHTRTVPDGKASQSLPYSSSYAAYVLNMPNVPPLLTPERTIGHNRQLDAIIAQSGHDCTNIPCMMLDDATTPKMIDEASDLGIMALKAYPIGVTTADEKHKHRGVSDFKKLGPVFKRMEERDRVLCLHGEVPGVFVLRREHEFMQTLTTLALEFPKLRIVLEHITTRKATNVVRLHPNVYASITAHHLFDNLDVVLGGMLNPHAYCKPVPKYPTDQHALWETAPYNRKFFFGSDSAPHIRESKECAHGCAGAFTAPHAIEMVATVFEEHCHLQGAELAKHLQEFLSDRTMAFYRLPPKGKRVKLLRKPREIPHSVPFGESVVIPYRAGETLPWTLQVA